MGRKADRKPEEKQRIVELLSQGKTSRFGYFKDNSSRSSHSQKIYGK